MYILQNKKIVECIKYILQKLVILNGIYNTKQYVIKHLKYIYLIMYMFKRFLIFVICIRK